MELLLALVDLLDDVGRLAAARPPGEAETFVQEKLRLLIELNQGEIIRLDRWDPALQRAVRVEPASAEAPEDTILRSAASGLKVGGRLVRKQEVVLARSGA